jgi:CubicO group peptidase (beta-lactamase class C family)
MRKTNRLLIFLSIFLSIILLPLKSYALSNDNNEINQLSDNDRLKIEEFIDKQMEKGKIPGISLVVVQGDKTIYQKGLGYSDIKSQKPVTSKSLFELCSNSKAFTALGILNLQKNRQIKLDDPVIKYIPWLKMKYQGKVALITIEELLYQTSGIPEKTISKIPISNDDKALEETVKTLINVELDSEPGKRFQYATINYDVLGLIIEKVTGVTYEKYLEENIIKPMGLNNTYLYKNETVNEYMAQGYKIEFLKPRLYDAPVYRGNKPAGYIISNAEDMAKWLKIQMGTFDGSKFNKDLIEDSHKPKKELDSGLYYASGWYVHTKDDVVIYHPGRNPNYSSFIVYNPEKKIAVAVLSNINSSYVSAIGDGIYGMLQGKDYNRDIMDSYKSADVISILIICIANLMLLITLYFIHKAFRQILIRERKYHKKGIKGILKISFSLILIIGLSCCLYLIPYIFQGVSWEFVYIWFPKSIKIALYFVYTSIWVLYIYLFITSFYKKVS